MRSLKIVFMGTPEFAVASLEKLHQSAHQVVAVVTAVDKPAGRGQLIHESEVKKCAVKHGIPVLQPPKLKDPEFIRQLDLLGADLFVVVAFRMLPKEVWSLPTMGTINLHGSLLPQYRGAAPIHHAVMNGETTTGVTTFFIEEKIDTGNIIDRRSIEIGPDENTGSVYHRLMEVGASLLVHTVDQIASGSIHPQPQADLAAGIILKEAPKLSRESSQINWNRTAAEVHNFVRGLSPFPAAWCLFQDKSMKIFTGHATKQKASGSPGSHHSDGKTFLRFSCADYDFDVTELQAEGKKRMRVDEWLRGQRINPQSH
ncbi:MAG: methionyl-tRNA formyltransferase [Flavobacteriales bacterium]|nr:methionyl-tRNA formyltransferase [Flavobacteriales bacterium]